MKKVLFLLSLTTASFVSFSQSSGSSNPLSFSVGAEAALPVGDLGLGTSFGIGASAQIDYMVAESVAVTGNVGYINFVGKSVNGVTGSSIGIIPVLAGIKYHFNDQFYGSAQLGMSFASVNGDSQSGLTFAPGVGYKINEQFDVMAKYTSVSLKGWTASAIGLRVAYNF